MARGRAGGDRRLGRARRRPRRRGGGDPRGTRPCRPRSGSPSSRPTLHHDTAAFVDAVAERLGAEGRWFHYGLTSSDVVDTALSLQIREAGALILEGIERALAAVVARAEEHRLTLQIGRTHGVHAEPTTFGLKLAGWAFELDRGRARVARALEGMRVGKLSGAVGTYAATDPELERIACERLGLEPAPTSTQILQRDRHAELLAALAVAASSLDTFALEIRHLARTEVAEVQEPFGRGQKGSSAMPHKRNPVVAERICGLARVVRAAAVVGLENVALWHERDISHSSAERVVVPDAFLALDYMLDRFTWLDGRARRPPGADAAQPRVEPLPLLQPARPARARRVRPRARRGVPARAAQRDARLGRGARLPRRSSAPTTAIAVARRPRRRLRPRRVHTPRRHRLRPPAHPRRRRNPSMPEATHVASGKVREIYALDDERLLLVASDRISTFDVVLPTEIPDKGRVLTGLSGFWFTLLRDDRPEPHARDPRGRRARWSAGGSRCCRSSASCAATSPARAGRTTARPARRRGTRCRRACASPTGFRSRSSRRRRRRQTGHDENISRDQAAELVGADRLREVERGLARALLAARRSTRSRAGSSSPTRSSSSASTADGTLVLGDEALTPDSSRFWPADAYEPGRAQDSFDKQFVRDYCEATRLGQDRPRPGAARGRRRGNAREVRRGVRAADRHRLRRRISPTRPWCSR